MATPSKLNRTRIAFATATVAVLVVPVLASGHVERPAYFPDPGKQKVGPRTAGGKVPKARSLGSALREKPPGETRVVCQEDSLALLRDSVTQAREDGYEIRPTDERELSKKKGKRLIRLNREFAKECEYDQIQPAVTDSRNNDRIVVMPGVYTEPTARRQPTQDPACEEHMTNGDPPSRTGALSYRYQYECPNDQNLIAVIGRKPGSEEPPSPPRIDRHGIPDQGKCIRCNIQIEGSGVSADDVVIEAGDPRAGNGASEVQDEDCPAGTESGTVGCKDVGIRADRADGFVLRKMTVRHANEHGIYVIETDGYLLDRFKVYFNGLYGTLTFVSDHGRQANCDGAGHGDSSIYPGAPPETGQQRPEGTPFRYNQEVTKCDMRHSLGGYSATNGNAVHIHHNNIYDNALGFNTDAVTSPGHPGFPGDSSLIEKNNFFSNNFNPYVPESDVPAAFPFPVGTAFWIAGGNHHVFRGNHVWDNWRRGTMTFSVPDSLICGPGTDNEQAGCDPNQVSTSHFNSFHGNTMGFVPEKFRDPKLRDQLDITNGGPNGEAEQPNGQDFWWDSFPGSEGNCWYANTSTYGEPRTSPSPLPDCNDGQDPSTSMGNGSPTNEGELISCLVAFESGDFNPETSPCPWLRTPPEPGTAAARAELREERARYRQALFDFCRGEQGSNLTCRAYGSAVAP
jgi:hypothetical protein